MKKVFSLLIRVVYFFLLIALLLSYLSPYANPKDFWLFAFFGLAYPFLFLANILFLFWWIIRWNKLYWLSLICILIGWVNMKNLIHFSDQSDKKKDGIKVLSYNVRLFDLYKWTKNNNTKKEIFSLLENESADILCMQEYFHSDSGEFNVENVIFEISKAKDMHIEYNLTKKNKDHWGIATYSKYPIINKGVVPFKTKSNNICIYSDLLINSDTIRVYNMHLQSISFGYVDYKFIESIKEKNDTLAREDIEIASKNILRRIKRAFVKRADQTERILAHIDSCPYPIVVCGDFNDTPFSFTYHSFSNKLVDSFKESGNGIGSTYIGAFPSYRIDYIFHSKKFTSSEFGIIPQILSDHYAIRCYLNIQ